MGHVPSGRGMFKCLRCLAWWFLSWWIQSEIEGRIHWLNSQMKNWPIFSVELLYVLFAFIVSVLPHEHDCRKLSQPNDFTVVQQQWYSRLSQYLDSQVTWFLLCCVILHDSKVSNDKCGATVEIELHDCQDTRVPTVPRNVPVLLSIQLVWLLREA